MTTKYTKLMNRVKIAHVFRHFREMSILLTEKVELEDPDYKRFPRLKDLRGHEAVVTPGDLLYIPNCWWHQVRMSLAGLPDFSCYSIPRRQKYTKWPHKIPNGRKIPRPNGHMLNTPTSPISKPYKIDPNWYFWFENIPSGNPGL
jgi:hypothetical protein